MSLRKAIARGAGSLQPAYVQRDPVGRDAAFRFSVPVLRVRDVLATVTWYRRHLGFTADTFPDALPLEFAVLERDGVQLLVRRAEESAARAADGHSGWDLYLWVDGADFNRLEASLVQNGAIVRQRTAMGDHMAELEARDPDGYVLCIGGPTTAAAQPALITGFEK